MSAGGSPARQLLLYVEDEAALEDLPIAEVNGDLAALGIDPAALIALARKRAEPPAAPPRPAAPTVPVAEPEKPDEVSYHVAEPAPDIMADMRIRPSGSPDDDERPRRRGGAVWVLAGLLVVAAAAGFGALKLWPEVADLDRLVAMVGPTAEQPAVEQPAAEADEPFVPAGEAVVVSRLEPVPPPAPPPTPVEARPAPAPAPPPQAEPPAPQPQPAAPTQGASVPQEGAPLDIIERPAPAPVQEARLPADVARPFTAPPSIVTIVPVERELLAASGTGVTSSRSRGGRSANETRLSARVDDARDAAAGRAIAALVTLQSAEGSFDAMILQRPEEEGRTIADADPALIPILGDTAHLFELVRLPTP